MFIHSFVDEHLTLFPDFYYLEATVTIYVQVRLGTPVFISGGQRLSAIARLNGQRIFNLTFKKTERFRNLRIVLARGPR